MKKRLQHQLNEIQRTHKIEKKRSRLRAFLAFVVSLSVLYALLLPAFTLEKTTYCGKEAHVHTDDCYEYVLDCPVTGEKGTVLSAEEFMLLPGAAEALAGFEKAEEATKEKQEDVKQKALDNGKEETQEEGIVVSKATAPVNKKEVATSSDYHTSEKDIYLAHDKAGSGLEISVEEEPAAYAVVNADGAAEDFVTADTELMEEDTQKGNESVFEESAASDSVEVDEYETDDMIIENEIDDATDEDPEEDLTEKNQAEVSAPENTTSEINDETETDKPETLAETVNAAANELADYENIAAEEIADTENTAAENAVKPSEIGNSSSEEKNEAESLEAKDPAEPESSVSDDANPEGSAPDAADPVIDGLENTEAPGAEAHAHVHTAACYKRVLICGMEEHEHSLSCYSDPNADIESGQLLEDLFPTFEDEKVKDSYEYAAKLAGFQKGYQESVHNYMILVDEDGEETLQGYTRYGDWAGDPYTADWSPLFAAFTLERAGIDLESFDSLAGNAAGHDADDRDYLVNAYDWMMALRDASTEEDPDDADDTYIVPDVLPQLREMAAAYLESGNFDALTNIPEDPAAKAMLISALSASGRNHENSFRDVEGYIDVNYADYLLEDEDGNEYLSLEYYANAHPAAPAAGELVFLDTDDDFNADHVGIITAVNFRKNKMTAMVGALDGRVREEKYSFDDMQVLGYASLPETEDALCRNIEVNGEPETYEELPDFEEIVLESEVDETEIIEDTPLVEVENLYLDDIVTVEGSYYTVALDVRDTAEIPEGAEVRVEEIDPESKEYQDYSNQALKALGDAAKGLDFARFFDISFVVDGEEIEPAEPIAVSISFDEGMVPDTGIKKAVHFAESGDIEVISVDADENTEELYDDAVYEDASYEDALLKDADDEEMSEEVLSGSAEAESFETEEPIATTNVKTESPIEDEAFTAAKADDGDIALIRGVKKLGRAVSSFLIKDTLDLESEMGMEEAAVEEAEADSDADANPSEELSLDEYAADEKAEQSSEEPAPAPAGTKKAARQHKRIAAHPAGRSTFSFTQGSFSVTGTVVYTVDFYYEINGKAYEYSLEGGDSMSLGQLISELKLTEVLKQESTEEKTEDVENINTSEEETAEATEEMPEMSANESAAVLTEEAKKFLDLIEKVEFTDPELLAVVKVENDSTLGNIKAENEIFQEFASWKDQGEVEERNAKAFTGGDWALISLEPFSTEEKLTVTLKNGEAFTITVMDAQDANMKEDGIHVDTVPNPSGTTIDLFNYWVADDRKDNTGRSAWPGFYDGWYYHDENDYAWYKSGTLLGEGNDAGINHGHMFKFSPAWAGTVYDGTIPNKVTQGQYSPTRNPTNVSYTNDGDRLYYTGGVNSYTGNGDPRQGLVEDTLVNGYPKLTDSDALGTNGESLEYLFKRENGFYRDYYGDVDHLLYVDKDGYYTYDSRDYAALLNGSEFELTEQTSDNAEIRGFWPFGQQKFWVGVHMNTQFSMPANGQVLNPKEEMKDMQFEFSGDDDTWLYVDGVLVGDGGGIHNRTEIDVNFATGKVTVTGKKDSVHGGTFEETRWLDDFFKAAGKYNDEDWEEIPGTEHKRFKAGTYHTFDMFYLERGGGESNLYIHYNLVSTEDFTGHKSYEGFADDERMSRDQFRFEMIGLDGQYQSVYDPATQTATVTKLNDNGHAIMPMNGTVNGAGTFADPKKVHTESAYTDSTGHTLSGTVYTTGVIENGDIRFGSANISQEEMHNCDEGHPSLYHYILREVIPDDAVNQDGVTWAAANAEQRAAGGFVKDQVKYDGKVYYMTASVTSWPQTGADGSTYTAYGLRKTYYTDDTFTVVDDSVKFVDFRNSYAPDSGNIDFIKVDNVNHPLAGATFTLYTDSACTKVAKDLGNAETGTPGTEQVKTTGEDGVVAFTNLAAPRTYYMKETVVPAGYEPNNTIYKVMIEDSKDTTRKSKIIVNGDDTETPITTIINTKAGEISVVKEWINSAGQPVSGGNHTARVKIQRKHYQQDASASYAVNFTIRIDNRNDLVYTYTARNVTGSQVTIDWWDTNQGYNSIEVKDSSGRDKEYRLDNYWDDTNHKNRKLTIDNVSGDINVTVVYPNDKDWLFGSEHTPWMRDVLVEGSGASYSAIPDETFNGSTESSHFATLAAPYWSKIWTIGSGKDFPASDGVNPYLYYVVEVDEDGNVYPTEETKNGYRLIGYSANNAEGITQGAITVTNQIEETPITVVIRKYDKTDLDKETAQTLTGAAFQLVKYKTSAYQETDSSWTPQAVTDTDGTGEFTFTGLTSGFYKIVETKTPAGYVKISADPTFEVRADASGHLEVVFTDTDLVKYISENGFRFGNEPGPSLPSTGGEGTLPHRLLGLFLIIVAGTLLTVLKKKELGVS